MSSAPVGTRDAGELLDQRGQPLGEGDAAGVDPDQGEAIDVGVLLDDLVRDAAQRALQIGLVEQHPACNLGRSPGCGSVVCMHTSSYSFPGSLAAD